MNGLATGIAFLAGIAAGAWQAFSIARSARGGSNGLAAVVRLLVVAAVLVVAARTHHLASATIGWLVGLVAGSIASYRRLP